MRVVLLGTPFLTKTYSVTKVINLDGSAQLTLCHTLCVEMWDGEGGGVGGGGDQVTAVQRPK